MQVNVQLTIGNPAEAIQVLAVLGNLQHTLHGLQADIDASQIQGAQTPSTEPATPSLVGADGNPVSAEAVAAAPAVQEVTYGDVEKAVRQRAKRPGAGGVPAVKEILAGFGVDRARKLDPSQYAEFVARCSA